MQASKAAGNNSEWLKLEPATFWDGKQMEIEGNEIYEVVSSKVDVAINRLSERNIVKITESQARWYTGNYYQCSDGKTPFLVRAVYGYGGTGKFRLWLNKNMLLIEHGSLGDEYVMNYTALIINLDFEPESLYVNLHIAK